MNNKKCETQTALKLLNQYADEYQTLEMKTKALLKEVNDLKSNLQINKEIIELFCSKISSSQKNHLIFDKFRNENKQLYQQCQVLLKENKEVKAQLQEKDQIIRTQTINYEKATEKLKTDLFIFNNIIKLKDSTILSLKKKQFHNGNEKDNDSYIEIYITSPSPIVNKLNDELETYKEINTKYFNHLNSVKKMLMKYDFIAKRYEAECNNYKEELNSLKQERNTNKIISRMGYNHFSQNSSNSNTTSHNKTSNSFFTTNDKNSTLFDGINKSKRTMINNLENANKHKMKMNKVDIISEWTDTLKFSNMTQDEYSKFCDNKRYAKLTDAIEYLYKVVVDKNIQIGFLTEENDCINADNIKLNRINIELNNDIKLIKSSTNITHAHINNSSIINKDSTDPGSNLLATLKNPNEKESSIYVNKDAEEMNMKKYIMDSITSSEFREGMYLDAFDFQSEISKTQNKN